MIRLDHITWTYPHADAPSLNDLDLTVEPGQFIIMCGASGSGKSTALRLINGLIPQFHDEGQLRGCVTVNGLVTTEVELDELGLVTGTVLQHPRRQFFTDSAAEELAFAMENFGFPPEDIRSRVTEGVIQLAAHVPVTQRLQRLSGGQQQQVAIAAATAHQPRILLLDEPSSNLSADAVLRLAATLGELKAAGMTIIVAEHRLRWLQDLADRIIVMRDGSIVTQWSADEFRRVPDEVLAEEGLRGEVSTASLPELPAAGSTIAATAASSEVKDGALELEDIHCTLGGRVVLDLDKVCLPAGSVTAVRGVNGAGKSTLARVISGLQPCAGVVRLDGKRVSMRARQRATAIVMQDVQRQLFTESVEAEIDLARTDAPDSPDTTAVLTALDLDQLSERHPLSLSGGQQQRLVIASVRVAARRVVIFDEPSSGVDRRHLQSISDQIRQVAADGAVVVLISHDEDLLAVAADHQITLRPAAT